MDLDRVASCKALMTSLAERYPTISQVLRKDTRAALQWLQSQNAVCGTSAIIHILVDKDGDDNIRTWTEYGQAIKEYLDDVNSDDWLEGAREDVAQFLYDRHYETFPRWPSVGNTQSNNILTNMGNKTYNACGRDILVWIGGSAEVTDERPERRKYIAKFDGAPTIRAIAFLQARMQELEDIICTKGCNATLETIRKKGYPELTWDSAF